MQNDTIILEKEVSEEDVTTVLLQGLPLVWHDHQRCCVTVQPGTNQISLNASSIPRRKKSF